MRDDGRTKLLYTARSEAEARMLADRLSQFSIVASVQGGRLQAARGEIPLTQQTMPQVWVFEDAYADAMTVLEAWVSERADDDEAGEDWTCPECGEHVEGVFDQCWNCETLRPGVSAEEPE